MVINVEKCLFNPREHEVYKALAVKQPMADLLTEATWQDEDGHYHAEVSVLIRRRKVSYRGDILICSSSTTEVEGHQSGVTCGLVELYEVKPLSLFTPEDWEAAGIPEGEREKQAGYGWMLRNPRRVIEMPVRGQIGLFTLYVREGEVMVYPREMAMGEDGWQAVKRRIKV